MRFIILSIISGRQHCWTTCGWSDRRRNARIYSAESTAHEVAARMQRDGLAVDVRRRR